MVLPVNRITRKFYELEDAFFEWRYNISLSGVIPAGHLTVASISKQYATAYQAVWCSNVRLLLSRFGKNELVNALFIDVGCGKGKPCFQAACYPFKSILGFDFDRELIDEARRNLMKATVPNKQRISFVEADANSYLLPVKKMIIFMFNPFEAPILESFITNNFRTIQSTKSIICYANDRHSSILANSGLSPIYRNVERKLSIWR